MRYGLRQMGAATLQIGVASGLPVHMRKNIVEVSDIKTHPALRRKGWAEALLQSATLEADAHSKLLLVMVGDGEEGGADKQALLNWYERHGFVPIQAEPLLMVRPHAGMTTPALVEPDHSMPVSAAGRPH